MTFEDVLHRMQEHGLEIESVYQDKEMLKCFLCVDWMVQTNSLCRWFFVHEVQGEEVKHDPLFGSSDLDFILKQIKKNKFKRS